MSESSNSLAEKRVLVTGSTGFLGKHAIREFSNHGYDLVATGRNVRALDELSQENIKTAEASLSDLANSRHDVDAVVHAAALSSPWGKWEDFYKHNVLGTEQVIDFCSKNDVKRLVFVSSPSIYSAPRNQLEVSEQDFNPANDLNNYIKSKILAEQILGQAHTDNIIPELLIIRPRGLIGVGDPSMIPRLLQANEKIGIPLFNNGQNLVDLTCVENAALALRLAVEANLADGQAYNITNGEPRPFKSIVDYFFEKIGKRPKYFRPPMSIMYAAARLLETVYSVAPIKSEPPITRYGLCVIGYSQTLDISRAKKELSYQPQISLDEGIENYAANLVEQS